MMSLDKYREANLGAGATHRTGAPRPNRNWTTPEL